MKTISKIIIVSFLTLILAQGKSINLDSYDIRLEKSYRAGNMDEWQGVILDLSKIYTQTQDISVLFKITQTQYGYIGFLIGSGKTAEARRYLKMAESNIEKILAQRPACHDAIAIKSSLYAFQIALSPYKAPYFGPRSLMLIDEAFRLNGLSPQVLLEKGNAAHYAPALFGGNHKKAIEYYSLAIEKLKSGVAPQSWILLNAMVQLAMVYEKAGMIPKANSTYSTVLALAPDFKWVKEELYPKFLKENKLL
jgi:tetratricopeptide (TPR) repeat protein